MKKKRKCQDINHWAWKAMCLFNEFNWEEYDNIHTRMKRKFGSKASLKALDQADKVMKMIS